MRKKLFLILLLLLSVAVLQAQDTDDITVEIEHDQFARSYYLHLPPELDEDNPAPVVIFLHGAGMSGVEMMLATDLHGYSDDAGYVMVYPNGIQLGWNYLEADELHPEDLYTDDVDFIQTVLADIAENYPVDTERVYIVGYSNGGMMAFRLRCEMDDALAGVVVIGANMGHNIAQHCVNAEAQPVPSMLVLGTQDHAFPWSGSAEMTDDGRLRTRFSIGQTITLLMDFNRCGREAEVERIAAEDSPLDVVRESHWDCDAPLLLYAIVDGSHEWPFRPRVILDSGSVGGIREAVWEFINGE
jgi:polyhydroxybutyrate depolymerase